MTARIYIPADSTARSLGADAVAVAVSEALTDKGLEFELVRTGSRGLYWLEPLLELDGPNGRIGFGPLDAQSTAQLFAAGIPDAQHPDCLGPVEALPALACQQRLTTARLGIIDPLSLSDYQAQGGLAGWQRATQSTPQQIVTAVTDSGLRGRGGAAFPTGIKWQTVLDADAETDAHPEVRGNKYIVCNADEGDSGTFVDRMIMEGDPFMLLEGMMIAGRAVGAEQAIIYCRAEYPLAISTLNEAIAALQSADLLENFSIEVRKAGGAYICGEETSMLESLEGKRGLVRYKPPLPAIEGLFGQPTVVNNVVSLASVPAIMANGPAWYREVGCGRSAGTLTVQLAGNVRHGGLYEVPFGMTLGDLIDNCAGGTLTGRPIKAVQAGGPLGAYIPPAQFDTPLDYEAFQDIGAMLGHGGLVVFDDSTDLGQMARYAMEFCVEESCGKCTPCRIGSVRGVETIDKIRAGKNPDDNRIVLRDLCDIMGQASLCAMGGMTPIPVMSIMKHWPNEL